MADLRAYLLEEAYEVVDAIDGGRPGELREELGDLLFQIVFLAQIAKEQGDFTVEDVVSGITEKMIRRHPHVFGKATARTSEEVLRQWEEIKRAEKPSPEKASALDGVPRSLPALLRAQRLTTKAARIGFDWPGAKEVLEKADEELAELREALAAENRQAAEEEVGDLIFVLANLARHLGADPESTLQKANAKFERRFRRVEELMQERNLPRGETGLAEMDRLWNLAKEEERRRL
jgi:MazG family protein